MLAYAVTDVHGLACLAYMDTYKEVGSSIAAHRPCFISAGHHTVGDYK